MIKFIYSITIPRLCKSKKLFGKVVNYLGEKSYCLSNNIVNVLAPKYYANKKLKGLNKEERKEKIIISMTTIPDRLKYIPITLYSIFDQSVKPDKVILWISDDGFNKKEVDKVLNKFIKLGLEIRYIKDVRVHTKYFYALKEFCDSIVITIDDDIFYPENLIEKLYRCHLENPENIICTRAHEITIENGEILNYSKWNYMAPGSEKTSHLLCATGVGGVLYPPKCLDERLFDNELFLKMAPCADDLWLKIIEILNDRKVTKISNFSKECFTIGDSQKVSLKHENVNNGKNDIQFSSLIQYFNIQGDMFK